MMWVLLLTPFDRWGNWSTERLSNFLNMTQLVSGSKRIQTWWSGSIVHSFSPFTLSLSPSMLQLNPGPPVYQASMLPLSHTPSSFLFWYQLLWGIIGTWSKALIYACSSMRFNKRRYLCNSHHNQNIEIFLSPNSSLMPFCIKLLPPHPRNTPGTPLFSVIADYFAWDFPKHEIMKYVLLGQAQHRVLKIIYIVANITIPFPVYIICFSPLVA